MLKICTFIQRHFTLCFSISLLFGVFLPLQKQMEVLSRTAVMPALMIVLFFSFLKLDLKEVFSHARRPLLLGYCLLINLLLLPYLAYLATFFLDDSLRMGTVLLVALPTGVAAAAITGMVKGKTSLTLILCTLSSLLVPVTIPLLFFLLFGAKIQLNYLGMVRTLVLMIALPMCLSELCKKLTPKIVARGLPYAGGIGVLLLCVIIVSVLGAKAGFIHQNLSKVAVMLLILYIVFILLQVLGFLGGFWLPKDERIALSVTKTVMNTALGIVLASQFFKDSPEILIYLILSEIPWSTVPGLYRFYPLKDVSGCKAE